MQKQTIKSKQEGFTIIEVLIVLAIAALILLVVFLAVPGLQRSQANNSAKNDATRVSAAITTYISNTDGTIPTAPSAVGPTAFETAVIKEAGSLGKLSNVSTKTICAVGCDGTNLTVAAAPGLIQTSNGLWAQVNGVIALPQVAKTNQFMVVLDTNATCPAPAFGANLTTVLSTSNQIALLYTTLSGAGDMYWNCIQSQ